MSTFLEIKYAWYAPRRVTSDCKFHKTWEEEITIKFPYEDKDDIVVEKTPDNLTDNYGNVMQFMEENSIKFEEGF